MDRTNTLDEIAARYTAARVQSQKSVMGEFGVPESQKAEHDAFWRGREFGLKELGDALFPWEEWQKALAEQAGLTSGEHTEKWEAYRRQQGWLD